MAVAVSLAAVIGASAIVGYYMHDESAPPPANQPTATTTVAATSPAPPPSPTPAAPAPASPTTVTVRQPPPTRSVRSGAFSTYVSWAGALCIQIRFPNQNAMPVQTSCDPTGTQVLHHTGVTAKYRCRSDHGPSDQARMQSHGGCHATDLGLRRRDGGGRTRRHLDYGSPIGQGRVTV